MKIVKILCIFLVLCFMQVFSKETSTSTVSEPVINSSIQDFFKKVNFDSLKSFFDMSTSTIWGLLNESEYFNKIIDNKQTNQGYGKYYNKNRQNMKNQEMYENDDDDDEYGDFEDDYDYYDDSHLDDDDDDDDEWEYKYISTFPAENGRDSDNTENKTTSEENQENVKLAQEIGDFFIQKMKTEKQFTFSELLSSIVKMFSDCGDTMTKEELIYNIYLTNGDIERYNKGKFTSNDKQVLGVAIADIYDFSNELDSQVGQCVKEKMSEAWS